MPSLEELKNTRLAKLKRLAEAGMDAYPSKVPRDVSISDAIARFAEFSKSEKQVSLAGRVLAIRAQGGVTFINFIDGTGTFQALFKEGDTPEEVHKLFLDVTDIGDFVSVTGSLFETKRGEKTLLVHSWTMAAKSLLPLPEKWHGLSDTEERFRHRYLDLLMNEGITERFKLRSRIISALRRFLDDAGFVEVETPMLQPHAGGATALPFVTHHNALDIDLYLRIAPELYLKQLLVGGIPKVYEIGRNFRNEGIDVTHNPEFTMLEFYESFSDTQKQMVFVEELIRKLLAVLFEKQVIQVSGESIDFAVSFARVSYFELLSDASGIQNIESVSRDELAKRVAKLGVSVATHDGKEKVLDALFKRTVRPKLIQPTFVTGYPKEYLPLAKASPENSDLVDAFQLFAGGLEIVKAFSELNDPLDQRARFAEQEKARAKGDEETQTSDEAFLEALEYGMPPAGGVGIGIDRMVMLFTDTKNIREVILFPTLRPKE